MTSEKPNQGARRLAARWLELGYTPAGLHVYNDASGALIYAKFRLEHPDGDDAPEGRKIIRPMKMNGVSYVVGEPAFPSGKRPLYKLDLIAANPSATIMVTEGEKAADALTKIGVVATTSGSATSAGDADWEPLRGKTVVVFPDADDAGKAYAGEVAALLLDIGCKVSVIAVDELGLPPKGDAVEWIADHPDATSATLTAVPRIDARPLAYNMPVGVLTTARVFLTRADSIQPEGYQWVWDGWMAQGKMHVIAGAAGTGKTTIALALAATITTGGRWPDGTYAKVANVVIWSGEDDPADTLIPRLMAMGADRNRVYFVSSVQDGSGKRAFDPAKDIKLLAEAMDAIKDVALLIVDPIVSAVAVDSHKNGEVRRGLQPLVDLAAANSCALLGITHYTKSTAGKDPLDRVTGSLAFGALARVVLGTASPTKEGAACRLVRIKSNIGLKGGGFEYHIQQTAVAGHDDLVASQVLWGAAIEGTARELLAEVEGEPGSGDERESKPALTAAINFLVKLLADGPLPATDVKDAAVAHGHSWATIRRAQRVAAIDIVKDGMNGGWIWKLIADDRRCSSDPEDAHANCMSTFGKDEHLRETSSSGGDRYEVAI